MGYDIIKAGSKPRKRDISKLKSFDRPFYVELIGVSGVGKSTLYKQLRDKFIEENNWAEVKDFVYSGTFEFPDQNRVSPVYKQIFDKKFSIIADQYGIEDQITFMSFFVRNIREEIIAKYNNSRYCLIAEDGFLFNYWDAIHELYRNSRLPAELTGNTAVVHCYNSAENVTAQVFKRMETTNEIRPYHRHQSYTEIMNAQVSELERMSRYVDFLEANGLRILRIDTSEDISLNAEKINRYALELQKHSEYRGI